jgi:acyl-coenzyme A synthetase/AMP-(fatty) acid ligase
MSESVPQYLYNIMHSYGDATAIIDSKGSLSYQTLIERSRTICENLKHCEINRGSIVAISLSNLRDFLPTVLGILEAGHIVLPIAPTVSIEDRIDTMNRMGASLHISHSTISTDATIQLTEGVYLHSKGQKSNPYVVATFPDAAIIRHTSGTTGAPKGVVLSHNAVLERTRASATLLGTTSEDVILSPVPLSYHFIASALTFLRCGSTIVETVGESIDTLLHLAKRHQATMIYGEPRVYDQVIRSPLAQPIASLRSALSTSSSLSPETAATFETIFGKRLVQVYGIIEVGLPIWNNQSCDDGSVLGMCLTPYSYKLLNPDTCADTTTGELCLTGPGMFSGYIYSHDHLERAPLIDTTWFPTGDIVTKDTKGSMTFRGRKKTAVTIENKVVFPEEIERVLLQHPDINLARVRSDATHSNRLIAEISINDSENFNIASLQKLCEDALPIHLVPSAFRLVKSLPTTGSGKIRRASLS